AVAGRLTMRMRRAVVVALLAHIIVASPWLAMAQERRGDDRLAEALRLNREATALQSSGHFPEALALARRALKIQEYALGLEHLNVAATLDILAGLDRAHGQYAQAELLYQRSLTIAEKALGPE